MSKINNELWETAEKLADRNYAVEIFEDTLSDGQTAYLASNPELNGCMAQGDSEAEARHELRLARINFIYFRLVDGKSIPSPPK